MKLSASGVHVLERIQLYLIFVQTYSLTVIFCVVACSGHFCFGVTSLNPVDRFYLNLVICLQLDIALLI